MGEQVCWHYFEAESFISSSRPRTEVDGDWGAYMLVALSPEDQRVENDSSHVSIVSILGKDKERRVVAAEYGATFVMNDDGKTIERI